MLVREHHIIPVTAIINLHLCDDNDDDDNKKIKKNSHHHYQQYNYLLKQDERPMQLQHHVSPDIQCNKQYKINYPPNSSSPTILNKDRCDSPCPKISFM